MISTKKLATIGAAAAMFALSAGPAFAHSGHHSGVRQTNDGGASNYVDVSSNTGGNKHNEGEVSTGDASTNALVVNATNSNLNDSPCGCSKKVRQTNDGGADNTVFVSSNTGGNKHNEGGVSTGAASTDATVVNLTNTNVNM